MTSRDVIAAMGDGRGVAAPASGSFTEIPLTGMRKVSVEGGEGGMGGEYCDRSENGGGNQMIIVSVTNCLKYIRKTSQASASC